MKDKRISKIRLKFGKDKEFEASGLPETSLNIHNDFFSGHTNFNFDH